MEKLIIKIDSSKVDIPINQNINLIHNEIIKYKFVKFIDKSRVDGMPIYELRPIDIKLTMRKVKIYKIRKFISNEYGDGFDLDYLNPEHFFDKFKNHIVPVSTLEDHISKTNFFNRYSIKTI